MSTLGPNNLSTEEFKRKVASDLRDLGFTSSAVKVTPETTYPNAASRPSNVDENGNIVDITKPKEEKTDETTDYSFESSGYVYDRYERGINEIFNCVKKIVRVNHVDGYSEDELYTIFRESDPVEILSDFSALEILKKIHEYDLNSLNKIIFNKGDEFLVSEPGYAKDEYDRLVTLCTEGNMVVGFNSEGKIRKVSKLNCKLTGKNYSALVDILNDMSKEDN